MSRKVERLQKIETLFQQFLSLLNSGMEYKAALDSFSYLHPTLFSMLRDRIELERCVRLERPRGVS